MPTLHDYQPALGSLAQFQDRGATRVRFQCLGCGRREDIEIGLLEQGLTLFDLAKRSACRLCKHRGAYVAPLWGLPKRHTGHYRNLEQIKAALLDQLDYVNRRLG